MKLNIIKKHVDQVPTPTAEEGDALYWDINPDGPRGFGLRITPKGVRAYIFQYRLGGRPARRMTIGKHGAWTAEKARARAKQLARDVDNGIDPVVAERERQRQAVTLEIGAYVETFTEGYLKTDWGVSWPQALRQLEMYVVPILKGTALPAIGKSDINSVFDKLKNRPALARNVWAALSKMMNWAAKRGDISASIMASMDAPAGVKSRKRILDEDEILALWRSTFKLTAPFGPYVRLLLITLQRRNEVAGIRWPELSHNEQLWRLPADRTKNGLEHLVPLSSLALDELVGLKWQHRGFAFTTTGTTAISGFSKMKKRLDGLMLAELQHIADGRADEAQEERHVAALESWRLHDLRRTGTTRMQRLSIPIETTERVINHHQGGEAAGIRGVYNLYEYQTEKTAALQAWADWLRKLVQIEEVAG